MFPFKNVTLESFGIEASLEQSKVLLRLTGTGDTVAVEPLRECLNHLVKVRSTHGINQLEVDIQSLYLLNSTCLKAFLTLIYSIRAGDSRLSIKFVVDKNLTWQIRTIAALKRMAPDIVSVSLYPKAAAESQP